MSKFETFREQYPVFQYRGYETEFAEGLCRVNFRYRIEGLCDFTTKWQFPTKHTHTDAILEKLLFSLGMVEAISYYKCVCPKVVEVQCQTLTKWQAAWWKKLFYHGLGEFQYLNGIHISEEELFDFSYEEAKEVRLHDEAAYSGVIVPVGGGKDSVVSLELLKDVGVYTFSINESTTIRNVISQCEGAVGNFPVRRILDKNILRLNEEGYLNGHIPFSAVVAFATVITAYLNQVKYIALSNENSANESTVKDSFVNHQYSKSFEFETDFTEYMERLCDSDIHYFSMLRPLAEIQIAQLFAEYRQYHSVFRSCNAGSKPGIWCCNCPKCLFVYMILTPFLPQEELVGIFGENLLEKENMDRYFRELTGIEENKPFECVGTRQEVCFALKRFVVRGGRSLLTDRYASYLEQIPDGLDELLGSLSAEHHIPEELYQYLERSLTK